MNDKLKTSSVDLFAKALLSLNDKRNVLNFLKIYVQSTKYYPFHRDLK